MPVKFEFQIKTNKILVKACFIQNLGHTYTKNAFVVYLKL